MLDLKPYELGVLSRWIRSASVPPKVTDDMTLVRRHSGMLISGFKGSGNAIARASASFEPQW